MKSEGVTVRPIKNYVGFHYFNEVFFEDVVVPSENLVGEENKGWYQLMQSLSYERGSVGVGVYGSYKRILDELIHYCKESQLFRDPKVRHMLVDTAASLETIKLFAYETIWKMTKGLTPIYEPSRDKAYNDGISEKLALLGTKIMGAYSQLDPLRKDSKWTRLAAIVESLYWTFIGLSIAAGTTDTQRNIIGQFGLDLPKSY
jgi:alkylation response protein AidB-like acyl-CoA dehydrogenase